jgi:Flp pilus assembly protein TadD/4-amino-4-deoxy-L-arabinose transferase-like glycosyltransferase
MHEEKRKRQYLLLAVFLCALGVRLAYMGEQSVRSPFADAVFVDAQTYHDSALEILGRIPPREFSHTAYYQPPLYPYFLALVYKVFSASFLSARIAQTLLGALSCVLVFLIAERYFSLRVAILAGFAAAFYRGFILFDGEILTPTLGMFLGLLGLYAASLAFRKDVAPERKTYLWAGASGLALGLMAVTIANVLLFAVFLGACILLDKGLRKRLALFACFAVAFAAPVCVTAARNHAVSGDLVAISYNGGLNFYIGNNLESEETTRYRPGTVQWNELVHMPYEQAPRSSMTRSQWSRSYYGKALSYILSHPLHYARAQTKKAVRFFNHVEIKRNLDLYYIMSFSWILSLDLVNYLLVCPFAVLGLALFWRRRCELLLLYAFFALYSLSVMAFFVTGRYRIPVIPVMIVFAAAAALRLVEMRRDGKALLKWLCTLALLFVFTSIDWFGDYTAPERSAENYVLAGEAYLKKNKPEKAGEFFEKAIELDPDGAEAHRDFGKALQMQGDVESARAEYVKAIELEPLFPASYVALAEMYDKMGEPRAAIRCLQEALLTERLTDEARVAVLIALAANHFNVGEFDCARTALDAALEIYPESPEVLGQLGVLYGAAGRLDDAVKVLHRAIELAPALKKAYDDLLFTYVQQGDAEAVRALLLQARKRGVEIDPRVLSACEGLLNHSGQPEKERGSEVNSP